MNNNYDYNGFDISSDNSFTGCDGSSKNIDNVFCCNCGNKLQLNEKYCVRCGADTIKSDNMQCEKCGTILPKDTKFCNVCGNSTNKTQKTFCQFCGEKYVGDGLFCKKCGHKIPKSDNFFGDFVNCNPIKNNKKNGVFINNTSCSTTKLYLVVVSLVILMFIFACLPIFTFNVDEASGNYIKSEINSFEELSEELNEEVKINIFHPLAVFSDYDDEIDGIKESGIEEIAELGNTLKTTYILSVLGAIIQGIVFAFMIVIFVLPLIKPIQIKFFSILPIIFSVCAIIYSIVILILLNSGVNILQYNLGALGTAGIKVSFSIVGWIYLVLSVALLAVGIFMQKKKKID